MAPNPENLVQCGLPPRIPAGWKILPDDEQLTNRIRHPIEWNRVRARPHIFPEQKRTFGMEGMAILGALDPFPVLGPVVWDSFLKHRPKQIPALWKEKIGQVVKYTRFIWFPGTLYESDRGVKPVIRGIYWDENRWIETLLSMHESFSAQHFFAIWME